MESLSVSGTKEELDASLKKVLSISPSLVLFFSPPALIQDEEIIAKLKDQLKDIPYIGCSSGGEICNEGLVDNTMTFLAIHFAHTKLKMHSVFLADDKASYGTGIALAKTMETPDLKAVFLLAPGLDINCGRLVQGMNDTFSHKVTIAGGMAGDGDKFRKAFTHFCGETSPRLLSVVGFYGDAICISTGTESGWRTFGLARKVTRSEGQNLYEIDNEPALSLYDRYLGRKVWEGAKSAVSYPLAILNNDRSTTGLIRTALHTDAERGVLHFAGDIPQGRWVCLTQSNNELLIKGAENSAKYALSNNKENRRGSCALLVSCVGRRFVMGTETDDEIDAVRSVLGEDVAIAGYYSNGEIGFFAETGQAEFHNQTMTVTYITERE